MPFGLTPKSQFKRPKRTLYSFIHQPRHRKDIQTRPNKNQRKSQFFSIRKKLSRVSKSRNRIIHNPKNDLFQIFFKKIFEEENKNKQENRDRSPDRQVIEALTLEISKAFKTDMHLKSPSERRTGAVSGLDSPLCRAESVYR